MNKKFDLKKLTLTEFKPSEFLNATDKLSLEQQQQNQKSSISTDPVPEGRTTLSLNKLRGVVSSQQTIAHTNTQTESLYESLSQTSSQPAPSITEKKEDVPETITSAAQVQDVNNPDIPLVKENPENSLYQESEISILNESQSLSLQSERAASLHAKTIRPQHKKPLDPQGLVAFNTRQPKWLKDKFFMVCAEKGQTPTLVIRNLMKSYCGLCLVLFVVAHSFSREVNDSTYSTDQLISYFYSKTFSGIKSFPDLKASLGARHSFWDSGSQDSTDYVYSDHSNTRLEAKVEIPILDLSYLKDRSKDKNELRAFVMKALSKILAAQKSVKILSVRSNSLNARLDYLRNQVSLKLLNKSDMFPVENEFYSVQTQLYESQSILEQRIIELAVIAGNDWLDAYKMIIKWDAKLFD